MPYPFTKLKSKTWTMRYFKSFEPIVLQDGSTLIEMHVIATTPTRNVTLIKYITKQVDVESEYYVVNNRPEESKILTDNLDWALKTFNHWVNRLK